MRMRTLLLVGGCCWLASAAAGRGPASPGGRIIPTRDMNVRRASHSSTLLHDGTVLIAGGFGGGGSEDSPYQTSETYQPATGAFVMGPSMHVGRSGHTATLLSDGRVLIAGGWTGRYRAAGTAEVYDPAKHVFTITGAMVVPRAGQTATLLPDGRVLMTGGVDRGENAFASAELYDPVTGRFTLTGNMTLPRQAHTATLLANGMVLIVGGGMGHYPSQTVHPGAELYDPATAKFTPTGGLIVARHKHAALLLTNGEVLVVGGSNNRDWRGQYASAELYNPTRKTFRATGPMAEARFKIPDAAVLLATQQVLVAGGAPRAEVYDPARAQFAPIGGSLGAARFFASVTALPDGRALITGGYAESVGGLPSTAQAFLYVPQ